MTIPEVKYIRVDKKSKFAKQERLGDEYKQKLISDKNFKKGAGFDRSEEFLGSLRIFKKK